MSRLSQFPWGKGGSILLEHAPKVSLIVVLARTKSLAEEQERTFSDVIFYHIKLRNFDPNRRYRNEASMSGVLYPYAHIVPYAIGKQCSYIIYNTLWRGLAKLLISLGKGNAKAGYCGISEEVSPTSFLYLWLYNSKG